MYERKFLSKHVLILVICMLFLRPAAGKIIYVDSIAPGDGGGASWPHAYNHLQDALAAASSGDELRVAQGTYRPDRWANIPGAIGDRELRFRLVNGVTIKGGYAGLAGMDPDAQDPVEYETILSGDLDGNDRDVAIPDELLNEPTRADNSYHVVYSKDGDETAVLNGFTIMAGNANNVSDPHNAGGGICNRNSSPSLIDCTFKNNSARTLGGAIYNQQSNLTISNCILTRNCAAQGGGIANNSSNPSITQCYLEKNTALSGAGIFNGNSNPSIEQCMFNENSAAGYGGGMTNNLSGPTITECCFTRNAASAGAGMFNENSNPSINQCTFNENSATEAGGGMANNSGQGTITKCHFEQNAASKGGAVFDFNSSTPTFTSCAFENNNAQERGGGMANESSNPELFWCSFSNNSASSAGGGIANYKSHSPKISHCIFCGNSSGNGGAIHNYYSSDPEITNCLFTGNRASSGQGGAIYNVKGCNPSLVNCSFSLNTAVELGGAISSYDRCKPYLRNCIVWDNYPVEIAGDADIGYSCIKGIWPEPASGNIDLDPLFVDPDGLDNMPGTNDDNLRLLAASPCSDGSPCVDEGHNDSIDTPYDLDGNPRIQPEGGCVDMGAYEGPTEVLKLLLSPSAISVLEGGTVQFNVSLIRDPQEPIEVVVGRQSGDADIALVDPPDGILEFDSDECSQLRTVTLAAAEDQDFLIGKAVFAATVPGRISVPLEVLEAENDTAASVLYVDRSAQGANNGTCWTDAFVDLQDGLSVAREVARPVEIRVANGIYSPTVPGGDRTISFEFSRLLSLFGGYVGCGEPDPNLRDISAYPTVLSGDLNGDDGPDFTNIDDNSHNIVTFFDIDQAVVLDGFTITGGNADETSEYYAGGGVFNWHCSPVIRNCTFVRNSAMVGGGMSNGRGSGGVSGGAGNPTLINCTFVGNASEWDGGGLYNHLARLTLVNCTFCENSAASGGGLYNNAGNTTLTNCIFNGNTGAFDQGLETSGYGGGICSAKYSSLSAVNCTFTQNTAGLYGGAVAVGDPSNLVLFNCILWDNIPEEIGGDGTPTASYCNIKGGWPGTDNIGSPPLFIDPCGPDNILGTCDDNLRLHAGSPCIDAGDNDVDVDLDAPGYQQLLGVDADLNVRRFDDPVTLDSGNGFAPIVDLGAYEFSSPSIPPILYVDDSVSGGNVGTSWNDAFADLQTALTTALAAGSRVNEIWVAEGTYRPAPAGGDRETSFELISDIALYGGFPDGGDSWERRNPSIYETILSGDLNGDEYGSTNNSDNSYHVVTGSLVNSTAVMDGFKVVHGNADANSPYDTGAGLYVVDGSPTIRNCLLVGNVSSKKAGGFYSHLSDPKIDELTLRDNLADFNEPDAGLIEFSNVDLQGILTLETGRLDVHSTWFYGPGGINLREDSLLKVTGEVDGQPTVVHSDVNGLGDIVIDAGQQLVIGSNAKVNLGGERHCNPDPNTGGHITVEGSLVVRDNATLESTNVVVKLFDVEDPNVIQYNNITLQEATTGFGGEFFVSGDVNIICNNIVSEGDRYLDLDPDPYSLHRPKIANNKITVIINEGILGSQGTLLELRAKDYDIWGPNNPTGTSGIHRVPAASEGFTPDPSENWVLERLELKAGAKLNLTNREGFEFQDFNDPNMETVYVKELVMGPNSVLNTALQTLYYQTLILVNSTGVELARDPDELSGPLVNGSRFEDIPLLGFSLGIIAMDDQTLSPHNEFDIRVRRRLRDPLDVQPEDPEDAKGGSIERINIDPDDPQKGGVMEMRTQALGRNSASSVAAKGAFARAGNEDITIEFQYMFREGQDAEIIVYLSDEPEVGKNLVKVAHIFPPGDDLPGPNGRFAVFLGTFARDDLNFTRGTYVQLELRGNDACCWIDNWDPQMFCNNCCDFDGITPVDVYDFYLLMAEIGLSHPSSVTDGSLHKGCLDLITDGCITIDDLMAMDAFDEGRSNLCPWSDPSDSKPIPADTSISAFRLEADDVSTLGRLKVFGLPKNWKLGGNSSRYLCTVDPDTAYAQKYDDRTKASGRLTVDGHGNVYQITGSGGLADGNDQAVIVPKKDVPYGGASSTVTVGVYEDEGILMLDAAFHPDDPSVVYVVPVLANPNDGSCPYMAAAKLKLKEEGDWELLKLYGKKPPATIMDCTYFRSLVYGPNDVYHPVEMELDPSGKYVLVLSRCWLNNNNWVLVYDEDAEPGNDSYISLLRLSDPNDDQPNVSAPTAMVASSFGEGVYLASSVHDVNEPGDLLAEIYSYSLNKANPSEPSLVFDHIIEINCPLPSVCSDPWNMCNAEFGYATIITSMAENPVNGTLYVSGFTAPRFATWDYMPQVSEIFTTPILAEVPLGASRKGANKVTGFGPALPLSIVWAGSKCMVADLTGDGDVDMCDVGSFAGHWLDSPCGPDDWCGRADLDRSTTVNFADLGRIAQHWLKKGCTE